MVSKIIIALAAGASAFLAPPVRKVAVAPLGAITTEAMIEKAKAGARRRSSGGWLRCFRASSETLGRLARLVA